MAPHFGRKGINPDKFDRIVDDWSYKIQNVGFTSFDYNIFLAQIQKKNSFIFLDPPYLKTKKNTIYQGIIDYNEFCEQLEKLNNKDVKWLLTLGQDEYIPKDLYKERIESKLENSSFSRLKNKTSNIKHNIFRNYE